MKGSVPVVIIIIVCLVAIVGMLCYIFVSNSQSAQSLSSSSFVSDAPTITVRDYAPDVPMSQKTTILIQTSDSSDVKYIVPTNQVATYVKSLPPGYHVVSEMKEN